MGMVAGVAGKDVAAQEGGVDVQVDFGCGYAFVAEHLLDSTQIGPSFKQM